MNKYLRACTHLTRTHKLSLSLALLTPSLAALRCPMRRMRTMNTSLALKLTSVRQVQYSEPLYGIPCKFRMANDFFAFSALISRKKVHGKLE